MSRDHATCVRTEAEATKKALLPYTYDSYRHDLDSFLTLVKQRMMQRQFN